jgi:hypothetical protein
VTSITEPQAATGTTGGPCHKGPCDGRVRWYCCQSLTIEHGPSCLFGGPLRVAMGCSLEPECVQDAITLKDQRRACNARPPALSGDTFTLEHPRPNRALFCQFLLFPQLVISQLVESSSPSFLSLAALHSTPYRSAIGQPRNWKHRHSKRPCRFIHPSRSAPIPQGRGELTSPPPVTSVHTVGAAFHPENAATCASDIPKCSQTPRGKTSILGLAQSADRAGWETETSTFCDRSR